MKKFKVAELFTLIPSQSSFKIRDLAKALTLAKKKQILIAEIIKNNIRIKEFLMRATIFMKLAKI